MTKHQKQIMARILGTLRADLTHDDAKKYYPGFKKAERELTRHLKDIEGDWISCADRLPSDDHIYIVYAASADPECPFTGCAWYDPGRGIWTGLNGPWPDYITHWMPMPAPPKIDKEKTA